MKLSLLTTLAAIAVASTTAVSLSRARVDVASVIVGLSFLQHSAVSAIALPQNHWLETRHRTHGQGNGNGNGNRNATANANGNANNNDDAPGRDRGPSAGNGGNGGNDGDNSGSNAPVTPPAPGSDRTGSSGGNNVNGEPSNGSQAGSNRTSTSTGKAPLTTGSGNAVGANSTSPGSDGGTESGTGSGTLPAGFPPAPPQPGFVAGENKRSIVAGPSRFAEARRDFQVSRNIGRTVRSKIPVGPKREAYRDIYDV